MIIDYKDTIDLSDVKPILGLGNHNVQITYANLCKRRGDTILLLRLDNDFGYAKFALNFRTQPKIIANIFKDSSEALEKGFNSLIGHNINVNIDIEWLEIDCSHPNFMMTYPIYNIVIKEDLDNYDFYGLEIDEIEYNETEYNEMDAKFSEEMMKINGIWEGPYDEDTPY